MKKIEDLRKALEAATPGEWTAPGFNSQGGKVACLLDNPDGLRLVSGNFKRPDAAFIALAHNLMPTLLEAVRWADATCEWVEVCFPEYADVEVINELKRVLEKLR